MWSSFSDIKERWQHKWYSGLPHSLLHLAQEEWGHRSALSTLSQSFRHGQLRFAHNETLATLLQRRSLDSGSDRFVLFEEEAFTFSDVDEMTNRYAHYLTRLGLVRGDKVAIMLPNCMEFLYAYYATQRMGLTVVPINTGQKGQGLEYLLKHSEAKVLFVDPEFVNRVPEVPTLQHIVVRGEHDFSTEEAHHLSLWGCRPGDVAAIMYTSGTSGEPKGVMLRYRNGWLRKMGALNHLIYRKSDVLYTCLPLFHANALFLSFSASLWLGIPIVLSKRFSASRFWQEVRQHGVTTFNVVGSMVPILLKNESNSADSENPVRLVLSAGCSAEHRMSFEQRFGLTLWEAYSAVDGGENFTFNMGNAPVGSIGKPMLSRYRVVDEQGRDCAPYESGELLFAQKSGGSSIVEYFKNPQASHEKNRDGFVHTGDLVYKDEQGFLYFVGRKTDSMRRRGENVSAFEVEQVLERHPDILECAVFGVPSEVGEEEIMAVVVPRGSTTGSLNEIRQWLMEHLAEYAVPRYFEWSNELPKTATYKVKKNELKQRGVSSTNNGLSELKENCW